MYGLRITVGDKMPQVVSLSYLKHRSWVDTFDGPRDMRTVKIEPIMYDDVVKYVDKENNTIRVDQCSDDVKMYDTDEKVNHVTVRWWDGYMETFDCTETRFGSDLLWMRLTNGKNRHIPLRMVRWFGMTEESHQPMSNM